VSVVGAYTFRWTIANAPCTASQDNVIITFVGSPTIANAGIDQSICATTGSATMAGNAPVVGAGTWTQVSGPVTATITGPTNRLTPITGMTTPGVYVFQWSISNAPCPASTDQMQVTVSSQPTISNAGPDQTICATSSTMAGNTAAIGTGTWTQISGPNTATITTPGSASTTMTGLVAGSYVFQWTISNAPCTASSDQVTITVSNPPTTANAGLDQTICSTGGSATMAGNTPTVGTGTWTQVSGPVTATITTASSPTTSITGMTTAGTYTFQWTIANAPCPSSSDLIVVTVNVPPTTANAGSNQSECGLTATLAGNTPVNGTGTWTQTAGPGTSTFSNVNLPTSTVTVTLVGVYTFQWTVANAPCTSSQSTVSVTFSAAPSASNAGPDDTICGLTGNMNATVLATGVGTWTVVSGPGSFVFGSPNSASSSFTASVQGVYVLQWTVSNGACPPSSDLVTLTISCDADGDGVLDIVEVVDGSDPNDPCDYVAANVTLPQGGDWNTADCDGDGVINGTEVVDGTNPNNPCDYVAANVTLPQGGDWNTADCDGDGVINGTEVADGTNPNDPCDYVTASITLTPGGPWNNADCDGDGVTNGTEIVDGTNPNDPCDYVTANVTLPQGGNWNTVDCDGDGVINGTEVADGTNPNDPCNYVTASITLTTGGPWNNADCDGDGVVNGTEVVDGTNPNDPCDYLVASQTVPPSAEWGTLDCDGDGLTNGTEYQNGNDPLDPCDPNPCDSLVVPNGFSPNGDNINDFFEIVGIGSYPNNTVTIFNRWGNLIYEAAGYNNGSIRWDGTNNGDLSMGNGLAPEGTYFYVINLGDGSPIISGYIYLNLK
jgi:gliding motility-associated-like protein